LLLQRSAAPAKEAVETGVTDRSKIGFAKNLPARWRNFVVYHVSQSPMKVKRYALPQRHCPAFAFAPGRHLQKPFEFSDGDVYRVLE
jgi:hypothetical protein